jgi:hypothetical protein
MQYNVPNVRIETMNMLKELKEIFGLKREEITLSVDWMIFLEEELGDLYTSQMRLP